MRTAAIQGPAAPAPQVAAFRIGAADDAAEREADAMADRALSGVLRRKCRACEEEAKLSRSASGGAIAASAGQAVGAALAAPGRPLGAAEAGFFGGAFGRPLDGVRLHDGAVADRAARSVGARAFALGNHVVFAQGEYRPSEPGGRRLLAHELAHVAQDRGGVLRRFTRDERSDISTLEEVIEQAEDRADSSGALGMMRWGRFVAANGGKGGWEALTSADSGSTARTNRRRYLFTCGCGLIDMRHFYQLMYSGLLEGNEDAVERGREHEETAEETSRFAPEDTPSNALGAYFGSEQGWAQRQSVFVANLRSFLSLCEPIDFWAMPAAERNTVLDWYAVDGSSAPAHPNEEASPNMPGTLPSCAGRDRFPFALAGEGGVFNRINNPLDET
ncbi:DUF4157 domain-containing protein [Roseomonas eburnea]|uniref:DUF4157 domain-containing protein n=1 Tax=Neoroseomonas eburnea TaxID=1346889 RepID=A0A9X9X8Y2_9PROT|nr:DUF4157 domain-containing protein [Neoroseomonas eburnea]MBR0680168.1 DUF4157 domain-containing protein [Neoroseomonas eburnea]